MIITRKDFAKKIGISYCTVTVLFDRFHVVAVDAYKNKNVNYDVSWYNLQQIKNFLLKNSHDYSKAIRNINKICEE